MLFLLVGLYTLKHLSSHRGLIGLETEKVRLKTDCSKNLYLMLYYHAQSALVAPKQSYLFSFYYRELIPQL